MEVRVREGEAAAVLSVYRATLPITTSVGWFRRRATRDGRENQRERWGADDEHAVSAGCARRAYVSCRVVVKGRVRDIEAAAAVY